MRLYLQFFGGRGASSGSNNGEDFAPPPTPAGAGRGSNNLRYGQPNTPLSWPKPEGIEANIGQKGKIIDPDVAIKTINPDRNALGAMSYEDYTSNCQRCAVAFELNRRGYNVEAEATYENDNYPRGNNMFSAFKNPNAYLKQVGASSTKAVNSRITDELKGFKEGGRGIVTIENGNGGHAFNVEYKNGKLSYYDAQTGSKYDPKNVFNNSNPKRVQLFVTNNAQLNDNIKDFVRKKRR